MPDLPRLTRLAMVANTGNFALNISNSEYTEQALDSPVSSYAAGGRDDGSALNSVVLPDRSVYESDNWYLLPRDRRDQHTCHLARYSICRSYNLPGANQSGHCIRMRIYSNIDVSIESIGGHGDNEINFTSQSLTPGFKALYSAVREFPRHARSMLSPLFRGNS